ncbi:MAG TPA: hypothetical protein VGJ57_11170 [Nitrospirales bacterium]|jgi:hypothetical protein
MRNKLPCTAKKLSQIEPEMIQSVVGAQVFQLGKEYQSANCVQILEADEDQILSEVTGPFGLYEQTIQLKGGSLLTKCSCTSNEQPFCRHCVAVLLGYQRPNGGGRESRAAEATLTAEPIKPAEPKTSRLSVNLHHITIFLDWLQDAIGALEHGQPLPDAPLIDPGDAMSWIRGIQNLHTRWRMSDDKRSVAEAEVTKLEGQLERMMKELEALPGETTKAQSACEDMQDALTSSQILLGKLSDMGKERDRLQDELRSTTEVLVKKGAELNSLVSSLKEVTAVMQSPSPSLS